MGLYDLFRQAEGELNDFLNWQIEFKPTNNYYEFCRSTANAEDILKYAILFSPSFVKVEGALLLETHYNESNWKQWRAKLSPTEAARVVNHTHIGDFLCNNTQSGSLLENEIGQILSIYWKQAVDNQYPNNDVEIIFDGDVINITQTNIME